MNLKSKILSNALKLGDNSKLNYAFDFRAVLNDIETEFLFEISKNLWDKIKHHKPEILVTKGMAGYPLVTAIKLIAYNEGINLATLIIRETRKNRGAFKKIVEGPLPKNLKSLNKAIFIDDIYNTGSTFKTTKTTLEDEGYDLEFLAVAVILDFWNKSRQLTAIDFPFYCLYRRHDLGLTREDNSLPTILDNPNWRLHIHHTGRDFMPTKSMPVIHDSRMFVGNDNNSFYCYDVNNGDLLWKIDSKLPSLKGAVCVAKFFNENVYYTSYDGTVRSINYKTGKHNWSVKADLNLHSAVAIDQNSSRLFLGTEWDKQEPRYGRGDIICLNLENGFELWRTPTRGMIPASPIYSDKHNLVLCGSNDFFVYILDADNGSIKVKIPTMGEVKGKIASSDDQEIFIAQTVYGNVHAFDKNGQILWTRNVGYRSHHPYPLVWGNSVYVTNEGSHVLSLDIFTGTVNWLTKLRGSVGWGVIPMGEHLFAITGSGYLAILNRFTGKKLAKDHITRSATVNGAECHQPAAYDGKNLIIVTNNKGILAYKLDISNYEFN